MPVTKALMGNMLIRTITESDLESMFSIMRSNMQPYYEARGENWNENSIRRYFLGLNNAVVDDEGTICAFTFYECMPESIHIHTFQVEASRQNGVLGGKLFRWYLAQPRQYGLFKLTCSVFDSNPALAMYLRMGFEEINRGDGIVQLSLPINKARHVDR